MNTGSGDLPGLSWPSRPGAASLRAGLPGTGVLGSGTPRCAAVRSPSSVRGRGKVAFAVAATPRPAPAVQPGQPNIDNYMTGAVAVREGASGPPPGREPA